MNKIIVLPYAEMDILNSVEYYRIRNVNLVEGFKNILNISFSIISENPKSFPKVKFEIRKFVMKNFPFI